MSKHTLGLSLVMIASCTTQSAPDPEPSAALRALGVEKISVQDTATQLLIEGRDVNEHVVASVAVSIGAFYMAEDDRGHVLGRQMKVQLGDTAIEHESEGYAPVDLPYPLDNKVGVFLTDPAVAAELAPWGITIEPGTIPVAGLTGEVAYDEACTMMGGTSVYATSYPYTGCTTSTFSGCAAYNQVSYDKGNGEHGEYRCCNSGAMAHRVCTTPNGSTSCGTAGPGGCKVCWNASYAVGCGASAITGGYCYVGGCALAWGPT